MSLHRVNQLSIFAVSQNHQLTFQRIPFYQMEKAADEPLDDFCLDAFCQQETVALASYLLSYEEHSVGKKRKGKGHVWLIQ